MSGYFSDRSMAVRALRQRAVGLTYGQRALVIGATHPELYVGTAQYTSHRETPWARLALTARLFETVFLGSREEADKALQFTSRRHATVPGASVPDLMWMTAAFTLDSVEVMHDELVHRLSDGERESLLSDFIEWACLFGMPREAAPSSYAAFRSRMDERLVNGEAFLTDEARLVGGYIAGTDGYPLPGPATLGSPALSTVIVGSLPRAVRNLYGLRWTTADQAAYLAITTGSRVAHQRIPLLARTPLLRGESRASYRSIAATERRQLRRGQVSMPGVSDVPSPY